MPDAVLQENYKKKQKILINNQWKLLVSKKIHNKDSQRTPRRTDKEDRLLKQKQGGTLKTPKIIQSLIVRTSFPLSLINYRTIIILLLLPFCFYLRITIRFVFLNITCYLLIHVSNKMCLLLLLSFRLAANSLNLCNNNIVSI